MDALTNLPNIGKILAAKLTLVGIVNPVELKETGSENALIKLATLANSGVCLNMLFAIEGAIQGIRWHNLSEERKQELKEFYPKLKME